MTATSTTTLTCDHTHDHRGTTTVCGQPLDANGDAIDARQDAIAAGWTITSTADYCPNHPPRRHP